MTPEQSHYLRDCNAFIAVHDSWQPVRRDGEEFYTPHGLKIVKPAKWRAATHQQIVAEMDVRGDIPVKDFRPGASL